MPSDSEDYESPEPEDYDDSEDEGPASYRKGGYHPVRIGDVLGAKYRVEAKLGWGHFSTVWMCSSVAHPDSSEACVAIKIQKSASHYTEAAMDEVEILSGMPGKSAAIVGLLEHFTVTGPNGKHVCMVFELLSHNLLHLIKQYDYNGVPMDMVRHIARDVLTGLEYIHTHCSVIHTDIKPENVILTREFAVDLCAIRDAEAQHASNNDQALNNEAVGYAAVRHGGNAAMEVPGARLPRPVLAKIGDFGNACWTYRHFTEEVATRQYRAPEAIVGCHYDTAIDIWATACLIFELITGEYLFDPRTDQHERYSRDEDHLALITELLGDLPKKVLTKGKMSKKYFKKGKLRNITQLEPWDLYSVLTQKHKMAKDDAQQLCEFMLPMLALSDKDRASASDCLQHPWLSMAGQQEQQQQVDAVEKLMTNMSLNPAMSSNDQHQQSQGNRRASSV